MGEMVNIQIMKIFILYGNLNSPVTKLQQKSVQKTLQSYHMPDLVDMNPNLHERGNNPFPSAIRRLCGQVATRGFFLFKGTSFKSILRQLTLGHTRQIMVKMSQVSHLKKQISLLWLKISSISTF